MNHTDLLNMCWNRDVQGFTEIHQTSTKTISFRVYRQDRLPGDTRRLLVFAWGPTKGQPFPNPTPDWVSNLKFWQKPILKALPYKAWATAVDEFHAVEAMVRKLTEFHSTDWLVFTGFSQGASIAMVAAFSMWRSAHVVTFASPACFNKAAVAEWKEDTMIVHKDYTMSTDPIKNVMPWVLGYRRTPGQQVSRWSERLNPAHHAYLPYLEYVAGAAEREERVTTLIANTASWPFRPGATIPRPEDR